MVSYVVDGMAGVVITSTITITSIYAIVVCCWPV